MRSISRRPDPAAVTLGAAALGLAGSLALFWPGVAPYDAVAQYGQVVSGELDDWHPPVMVVLWRALATVGGGQAPMLVVQLAGWWGGLGLIAAALARSGRRWSAAAAIVVAAWPLFLGWQGVVLKDAQLVAALMGAAGLIGWWRLRGERVPAAAKLGATMLLGYALLVRANAAFAAVPLIVGLTGVRGWRARGIATLAGIAAVLAVSPAINHGVFGAKRSGVEKTQPVYDLAGIAMRSGDATFAPEERAALVARRCVTPFFWDPLGDPTRCGPVVRRLWREPAGQVYARLAAAAARQPLAYAGHRLAHLNSTERWLVAPRWPFAAPPPGGERERLGMRDPGPGAGRWQRGAAAVAATPLGWPIAWAVAAVTLLAASLSGAATPARSFAHALLASALVLEASFAAVSIASDLRYHLWPMAATALAAVLLAGECGLRRSALIGGGAALAVVVAAGTAVRTVLPPAPDSYRGMLLNL